MKKAQKSKKKIIWIAVVTAFILFIAYLFIDAGIQNAKQEAAKQAEIARVAADPINVNGIYNALNTERTKVGAPALSSLQNLTTASNNYCGDMVANDYFDYKNPKTGKEANSFITDSKGNLYYKHYVSSIFQGNINTQSASDVVSEVIKNQATNLNNPIYNSVGFAVCGSPATGSTPTTKYIVGTLAENTDPPVKQAPTTVYQAPAKTSINCSSYEIMGVIHTNCY